MKLHRFLVEKIDFVKENSQQVILNEKNNTGFKNLYNQLFNVFRFKVGSEFVLFDGSGTEYFVSVVEFSKKEVLCEVKEEKSGAKRSKHLTLCFSMIKKENMETVVNMCTQLGVTNFIPFISERTVKTGWNFDRMQKIVVEAVEQSGFSDVPQVAHEPERLAKLLEKFKEDKENLDGLCALDFSGTPLASVKHLISVDTIFVGPEGGFTEKEVELFRKYNIKILSLGENILRAETACISISSIFLL